ncbi:cobalamin adenosyltransferase [Paenibacillus sp. Soil766]|uniref:cob(I)yrinic acid a,c-diamide adenosyltransferase n=1 Tax=Paenibacillus sp. Soil766 TaxID=1736404 RepID=UPI0007109B68|nr:cob(I)yrinic acid a,c-diamide adenosyltransferase [Paenibacillus sp. Soil766]KRF03348.1 cobalamin adenosyltransferase [Paenibacillus sp. Soil766]
MRIYTKTGDLGETSIVGGRVSKASVKVDSYGTIDEANSIIGIAITYIPESEVQIKDELEHIQQILFDCGSDLSKKEGMEERRPFKVTEELLDEFLPAMESCIDAYIQESPQLERFVLPGGSQASAFLHLARTVVRRAERRVVALSKEERINPHVLKYLNRTSDYLFAAARVMNYRLGVADVEYVRSPKVFREMKKKDANS